VYFKIDWHHSKLDRRGSHVGGQGHSHEFSRVHGQPWFDNHKTALRGSLRARAEEIVAENKIDYALLSLLVK
jgi:hypothetical protein